MTRMTNDIADTITSRIINYKFKTLLDEADKAQKAAGDAFYDALYAPFEKAMKQLPLGAFNMNNNIKIGSLFGERVVLFSKERPVFKKHDGYGVHVGLHQTRMEANEGTDPIPKTGYVAIDTKEAYDQLKKDRLKTWAELEATIRAYTTIEKLVGSLPSTEAFVYGISNNTIKLPMIQVEQFNATFGLPADPAFIKAQVEGLVSAKASQGNG